MKRNVFRCLVGPVFGLALSSPALADGIDPCLVGLWGADLEDMAHVYKEQMQASSVSATGDVRMRIYEAGNGSIDVQELVFDVVMPDLPPMLVTTNGGNDFGMTTTEGAVAFTVSDYSVTASVAVLGTVLEVPVTSEDGLLGGGGIGIYGCTDTGLAFEMTDPGRIPRKWFRLADDGTRVP